MSEQNSLISNVKDTHLKLKKTIEYFHILEIVHVFHKHLYKSISDGQPFLIKNFGGFYPNEFYKKARHAPGYVYGPHVQYSFKLDDKIKKSINNLLKGKKQNDD